MKNFWLILLTIFGFFIAALAGYLMSDYLNTMALTENSDWITIKKSAPIPQPTQPSASQPYSGNSKVTCTGCDHNPLITTSDVQQNSTLKKTAVIGKVIIRYNYTPDYYPLAQNRPITASEIVYDILRRQDIGHLASNVNIPNISYLTTNKVDNNGVYTIPAGSVQLARNATLTTSFSISIPVLSDKQFDALKYGQDYHLIYGLIRGIVGHEELHYNALTAYINDIADILNNPISKDLKITASSETEMQNKLNAILLESTKKRLATARARHEATQNAIDDEALKQRITLEFKDKVNGDIPALVIGEFRGEGTFNFTLPPGPIPKPPIPNINVDNNSITN
ncbi:MAG: hypothetical protein Q7S57_05105 [bacterium]|nr:hypothetical protein [bacterium]